MRVHKRLEILWALSVANAVLLALLWFAEVAVAERHWLTTLVTYAPQQIYVLPLALLLALSLSAKDRRALWLNLAVGFICLFTLLGFNVPLRAPPRGSGPVVRVMTYNAHQAREGTERLAKAVRDLKPDVLCLQEVGRTKELADPVRQLQRRVPGYHVARDGACAILSRYPIERRHVHYPPIGTGRAALEADVRVGGTLLSVVTVHFNTAADGQSLSNPSSSRRAYLRHTAQVRSAQARWLLGVADSIQGPVVLTGDFNTPPRGRVYPRLARRYQDAFRAAGWGTGYTYRDDLPVLRIDYVFVDPDLDVARCFVPRVHASDHRPVVADISLGQ